MKGHPIPYSAAELVWIKANAAMPRDALTADFNSRFGRKVAAAAIKALCWRKGWKTGRDGRFTPGLTPHNKGRPAPLHANSVATRFQKGNVPHTTRHLGHERETREGYIEVSVAVPNRHTGFWRSYVLKHVWRWQQVHGPVPEGMCLKCRNGNRADTEPDNWELVPRAILPRLNGGRAQRRMAYDAAPAELKPTLMAVARLEHATAKAKRREGYKP